MTSFVQQHLAEIEKLISVGVYQDAICQELAQRGMVMSVPAFRKALSRARQNNHKLTSAAKLPPSRDLKAQVRNQAVSGRRLNASEFQFLQMPTQYYADSRSESASSEDAKRN